LGNSGDLLGRPSHLTKSLLPQIRQQLPVLDEWIGLRFADVSMGLMKREGERGDMHHICVPKVTRARHARPSAARGFTRTRSWRCPLPGSPKAPGPAPSLEPLQSSRLARVASGAVRFSFGPLLRWLDPLRSCLLRSACLPALLSPAEVEENALG